MFDCLVVLINVFFNFSSHYSLYNIYNLLMNMMSKTIGYGCMIRRIGSLSLKFCGVLSVLKLVVIDTSVYNVVVILAVVHTLLIT